MSGLNPISMHTAICEEASTTDAPEKLVARHDMTDYRIELGDSRERLVGHPIYNLVTSPERMKAFMEAHIWAVWDFQSLLKAVQQQLSCVTVPWTPTSDAEARRLINEIVLDEESDELPNGSFASHFELYLRSMEVAGAATGPIVRVIEQIKAGVDLSEALLAPSIPPESREFVNRSFSIINSGSSHRIVAAFTYGREDVIPDMFRQFVEDLLRIVLKSGASSGSTLSVTLNMMMSTMVLFAEGLWQRCAATIQSNGPKHQSQLDLLLKHEFICGTP